MVFNILEFIKLVPTFAAYFKIERFILSFPVLVEGVNGFESGISGNRERLHSLKKDCSCYSLGASAERRFYYWN